MSLKLSPGCQCCGPCEACSSTTHQSEYDVTLSGLSNGTLCSYCEVLNGTFSLNTYGEVLKPATGWATGWNRGMTYPSADAADAVAGATSACVWNYGTYVSSLECLNFGPWPISERWFWLAGLTLAKFKISDVSYIWRLIVNARLIVNCRFYAQNVVASGWYWETTSTTKDCHFDGTETWTANTPSTSVSITCDGSLYTLNRSDFCTGNFTLTSVVDG
jgi:hypothetical protein